MLNHFPIALFVTSVGLDLLAWWRPSVGVNGWPLLWIAALMAVPTTITGLIAHIPYENSPAIAAIDRHEQLALITTFLLLVLMIWRWRAQRRGRELGQTAPYLVVALVALVFLTLTGATGGELVYTLGVGVAK